VASPLEITLNYQALAFYKTALRLNADNFPYCRGNCLQTFSFLFKANQIEENTYQAIFLLITGKLTPWRISGFYTSDHSPLDLPHFTVTTFIEGCFRSDPGRPDAAVDFLS